MVLHDNNRPSWKEKESIIFIYSIFCSLEQWALQWICVHTLYYANYKNITINHNNEYHNLYPLYCTSSLMQFIIVYNSPTIRFTRIMYLQYFGNVIQNLEGTYITWDWYELFVCLRYFVWNMQYPLFIVHLQSTRK